MTALHRAPVLRLIQARIAGTEWELDFNTEDTDDDDYWVRIIDRSGNMTIGLNHGQRHCVYFVDWDESFQIKSSFDDIYDSLQKMDDWIQDHP